jgi:K+-sensing histidine kinase KdpD
MGPGVTDDDRERIFAGYGRGAQADGRREGLGLGLSVARRIAEAHSGHIEVDLNYHDGARFVVSIPRTAPRH